MLKIIHVVFIVIAITFISGCKPDHHIVYKKFNTTFVGKASIPEMTCELSLDGTAMYNGEDNAGMGHTYVKSPYTLFIVFHFPKEQSGIIELKEITFYEKYSLVKQVTVNSENVFDNITEYRRGGVPKIREEGESTAAFLVRKKISIPHSKLRAVVTAVVYTENSVVHETLEFELNPVIEEELRNDLRDSFMSV